MTSLAIVFLFLVIVYLTAKASNNQYYRDKERYEKYGCECHICLTLKGMKKDD